MFAQSMRMDMPQAVRAFEAVREHEGFVLQDFVAPQVVRGGDGAGHGRIIGCGSVCRFRSQIGRQRLRDQREQLCF